MEKSKLLAALEANIENDWKEIDIGVFDQLLVELERGGRITTAERQSLLLKLGLKKIREESQGSGEEGENADPLRP